MPRKASGKKRESSSFAQTFRKILQGKPEAVELAGLEEDLGPFAAETPRDEIVAMAIVRQAMHGNLSAAKLLREISEEAVRQDSQETEPKPYQITLLVREENS